MRLQRISDMLVESNVKHKVVAGRDLSRKEHESIHKRMDAFNKDFARLVRKYVPVDPDESDNPEFYDELLRRMQDDTSVFKPYVWDDQFKPKKYRPAPKRVEVPFATRFNKIVDLGNKIGRNYKGMKDSTLSSYLRMLMDALRKVLGESRELYLEGNEENWKLITISISEVYNRYDYKSDEKLIDAINEARWHVVMHTLNMVNAIGTWFSYILTLESDLAVKIRRVNLPNDR